MRSFLVFGVLGSLCSSVLSSTILPIDIHSWAWHRAIAVGSWLYIDGGEINNGIPNVAYSLASTVAIDLSHDWTNATVPSKLIDKPAGYPLARRQIAWADEGANKIYAFGGWPYWDSRQSNEGGSPPLLNSSGSYNPIPLNEDNFTPHPQTLWTLELDGAGGGSWTSSSDPAGTSNIEVTVGSSLAISNTTVYSAGGQFVNADWGNSPTPGFAVPGLSTTSATDAAAPWKNGSTSGFSIGAPQQLPWVVWGEASYTARFGAGGIIVYFGGYSPTSQVVGSLESSRVGTLWDMSSIVVYDIASGTWANQTAQGDIPPGRWGFCSVSVSESSTQAVDIFIYGGSAYEGNFQGPQPDLTDIYVLTLPSFVWTKVQASTTNVGRAKHACAVIGRRQMAIIGGGSTTDGSNATDPWNNTIGIFDMTALSWANRYDSGADAYRRHPTLQNVSSQTPMPEMWNSPQVQQIFSVVNKGSASLDAPSASSGPVASETSEPPNSGSKSTPVGAIAGGVVGGLAALLIVGVAILLFVQRRRAKRADTLPYSSGGMTRRHEMDARRSVSELQASEKPVEKDAEAPIYELDSEAHRLGSQARLHSPGNREKSLPELPAT